jgi:hypothetical protein
MRSAVCSTSCSLDNVSNSGNSGDCPRISCLHAHAAGFTISDNITVETDESISASLRGTPCQITDATDTIDEKADADKETDHAGSVLIAVRSNFPVSYR